MSCRIRDKLNKTSIIFFFFAYLCVKKSTYISLKKGGKSYLLLKPLNCKVSSCRFRQILTLLVTDGRIQLCWNWDYVSLWLTGKRTSCLTTLDRQLFVDATVTQKLNMFSSPTNFLNTEYEKALCSLLGWWKTWLTGREPPERDGDHRLKNLAIFLLDYLQFFFFLFFWRWFS